MSLFWSPLRVTGDAFHSSKTSGLNFQQLPGANGTAFSKISKTGQPHKIYPNFRNFFPRSFFFHSSLLLENLEFSFEWFAFWKFNRFFLGTWKGPIHCGVHVVDKSKEAGSGAEDSSLPPILIFQPCLSCLSHFSVFL